MLKPTLDDVQAAAATIKDEAVRTPLLRNDQLDARTGARCFLKAECLQRTGSFKFRGAFSAISQIPKNQYKQGVVACSSGNHAQGIAEAARLLGLSATIVMPSDAPRTKVSRTERSGAKIVPYDRLREDREKIAESIADATGATMVHPYENFHVVAGQGTCGLEVVEQCNEMGVEPDHVLVCTGGGGLLAGMQLALLDTFPDSAIHTVEPFGYDDQARSHAAGERLGENAGGPSLCDAIVTPMPGALSFEMCRGRLADGYVVSDEEVLDAVAFAYRELKVVVEPGGAAALAALLCDRYDHHGCTIVATLSGGNIDEETLQMALDR